MIKKLNIIEAMKMPIGTQFNIEIKATENTPSFLITDIVLEGNSRETRRAFLNLATEEYLNLYNDYLDATFIPIQQPVSFMEAITSGKRIKCVYEKFNQSGIYMTMNTLFRLLSLSYTADFIPNLIKEGKWYIEESEADSNEQ